MERQPKFPIGTKFKTRGEHSRECTVTDILTTRNAAGYLVRIRYVAEHVFLGQTVTERDICEVTISRGLIG